MAKTMNINLVFSANTQQAKAQLEQLKGSLNNLSSNMSLNRGMTEYNQQLKVAAGSLAHLQAMLNQATTATGQLDISKFSLSMQKAGMSMEQFRQDLSAFGAAGEEAFIKLSRSVMNGQMPIRQTNMAIDKLWGSMKNVATWQISSKILYGFMNQISTAYNYVQDLNESLNNIRIVTGYGTEEMSKFAEQANKAAKALSASTLEYTDAALIYYQQGLSGKEVTQRADATIKLANVARTSGEEASEWMTAIWNNFDNGSKSLEYYADVLTKLGAETASSADEIAGGLEKFSAVANTVGLSYEYAAAALATITAQTRQSEDVVGTSLKTLFARIENLSLGDTLDDGTTLNKYSEALYKVGINIKDTSGELKSMDTILNEMGATWNTLSKGQQIALAQTVGGIRQYNQLIALMDNWDFFEKNVDSAKNATGELNKQNEIYAESWEAANKKVKASAEDLYQSLLDDKFFISLTNGAGDFLTGITEIIDAMGGLKTLLPSIVLLFNKLFGEKMIVGARNMMANISMTSKAAQQRSAKLITDAGKATHGLGGISAYGDAASGELERTKRINEEINKGKRELTQIEQDEINLLLQKKQIQEDLLQQNAKEQDSIEKQIQSLKNKKNILSQRKQEVKTTSAKGAMQVADDNVKNLNAKGGIITKNLKSSTTEAEFLQKSLKNVDNVTDDLTNSLKQTYQEYFKLVSQDSRSLSKQIQEVDNEIDTLNSDLKQTRQDFDTMEQEIIEGTDHIVNSVKKINADYGWDQAFMGLTNGIMSATMAIGALQSAWDSLKDGEFTFDDITSSAMAFAMAMPLVTNVMKLFEKEEGKSIFITNLNTLATKLNEKAKKDKAKATNEATKETEEDTQANNENTVSEVVNTGVSNTGKTSTTKGSGKKGFFSLFKGKGAGAAGKDIPASDGGSGVSALSSMLGSFALIAAGITIMVTSIKLLSDHYNKLSKEAEKAGKTVTDLRTTAQETTEAYNNMLSTSKDYEDGYKGLEKLTKGTNEYKQALLDTNAKARELIKTYDNLEYSIDENGAIKIDEDSLAKAQNQQYQKALAADAAATSAEQRARELDNDVAIQRELRNNNYNNAFGEEDKGAALGAAGTSMGAGLAAAGVASLFGPIGWVTGAAIALTTVAAGLTTYAVANEGATQSETAAIETLTRHFDTSEKASRATEEEMRKVLEKEGYDKDLIDALMKNSDQVRELVNTEAENNELLLKENQLMVKQQMQANGEYEKYDKNTAEYVSKINGANLEFEKDVIREEMSRWGKDNISKATGVNDEVEKLAKEYFAAANISGWKVTDTTGTDGNRKFVFKDENGEEQIKTLEEMKEAIISHKALEATAINTEETAKLVAKLSPTDEGNALLDYIAEGNFNSATKTEMDKLKKQTNTLQNLDTNNDGKTTTDELAVIAGSLDAESELEDLETEGWGTTGISRATGVNDAAQKVADEYLEAIGEDDTLTDTSGDDEHRIFYFEKLGPVSLSEMKREVALYRASKGYEDTVDKDIKAWEEERDSIDDDLYSHELNNYQKIINKDDLSNNQLKQYKNLLQEASMSLGANGAGLFTELYNSVAAEDKDTFTTAIGNIDWANTTVAEATAQVKDIVDTTSSAWQEYSKQMYNAAQQSLSTEESFKRLTDSIKDIKEIVKDLKLGEVISDEDYEKIIEKNKALANSFVRVAEGWRVITDPENIQTGAFNAIEDDFDTALEKAQRFENYVNTKFKNYLGDEKKEKQFYSDMSLDYEGNEANKQNTADAQYDALRRTGAISAATQGEDGKWYASYTEDMTPLLERARVSKDDYLAAVNEIIQGDKASDKSLEIMELIHAAAKNLFTESLGDAFSDSSVMSVYTDIYDNLSDVNRVISQKKDVVTDTSKAYNNYIAKKTSSLEISAKEMEVMKSQIKGLKSLSAEQKKNATLVGILAVENEELERGMVSLIEHEEDYLKALESNDLSVITGDMATSIGQILGNDVDYEFIITNLDIIKRLMRGEVEAIDDLQQAYSLARIEAGNYSDEVKLKLLEVINNTNYDVEVGASVDFTNLYNSLDTAGKSLQDLEAEIQRIVGSSFTIQLTKDKDGNVVAAGTKIRSNSSLISGAVNRAKQEKAESNKPEEFDPKRYHEIDEVLDSIGKKLDVISTKKDKAFGADKIKYVKDELKLVSAELDATKTKLDQAKSYLETDKNTILKYGVELDEDGNIKNYNEVRQRYYEQYKTNPEAYEDSWKQLNEDLDRYEQTLDEVTDLEKDHLDQVYKMKELALEEIELTVTFNIEASDDVIKYLDFVMKRLEEDTYDAAESIDLLGQKTQETLDNITTYKKAIEDTLDEAGFTPEEITRFFDGDGSVFEGKTLTEDESKMLRDYRDKIIESSESLREFRKQVFETALNAFNTWNEKLNENADKLERCNKLLETHKNIVDVVGRKYLNIDNEVLRAMAEARTNLAQSSVEAAAATYEANKATLESAKQELEKAKLSGDEDSIKEWEEFVKNVEKTTNESEEAMMDALVTAMETAGEVFEETVQRVMETLNEALGNIKELTDKFEKQRKIEELYLADHKKLYEINKLNRDIQNSIDSTDNVKAQRELAKISEEVMAYQAEGAQMSEYDLGYLQKRYELKKAEIALEEAQNAKNQVKLQRDSKGNWGYVYTADQKNIDKAQQDFNKSLYEVQEYSYQSERELVKQRLQLYEDQQNEISALREEDFASVEEYDAKLAEIKEHYTTRIRAITLEIKDLTAQNAIINQEYSTTMADTYSETLLGQMYPTYSSFEELMNGESQAIENSLTSLSIAYSTWSTNVNTAMTNAKIDAETFATYMSGTFITDINKAATDTTTAAGKIATEMKTKLTDEKSGAIKSVESFVDQFKTAMGDIYNKGGVADKIAKAMTDISKAATDMADTVISKATAAQDAMNLISNTQGSFSPVQTPTPEEEPVKQNWDSSNQYDQAIKYKGSTYVRQNGKWYKASGSIQSVYDDNDQSKVISVVAMNVDKTKTYSIQTSKDQNAIQGRVWENNGVAKYNFYNDAGIYDGVFDQDNILYGYIGKYNNGNLTAYALGKKDGVKINNIKGKYQVYSVYEKQKTPYSLTYAANPSFADGYYKINGNHYVASNLPNYYFGKNYKTPTFDTGGYTGSWGTDGRLAVLHQKEIVLNSHDTENFLSAVKIVRSMSDMLEHNAHIAMQGLNLEHNFAQLLNNKQPIEQNVKIEASFPNVTDRYEIEQAFNSLINDASQYANRK